MTRRTGNRSHPIRSVCATTIGAANNGQPLVPPPTNLIKTVQIVFDPQAIDQVMGDNKGIDPLIMRVVIRGDLVRDEKGVRCE